ncbi:MAG: hypothetical protein MJ232_03625 [archaeon]|nr:hypothetical protein [archaeon]
MFFKHKEEPEVVVPDREITKEAEILVYETLNDYLISHEVDDVKIAHYSISEDEYNKYVPLEKEAKRIASTLNFNFDLEEINKSYFISVSMKQ